MKRVRRSRRRNRDHKRHLLLRYGNICLKCRRSKHPNALTIDHIVPWARGGTDELDNKQLLCARCNRDKACEIADYR